VLITHGPPEGMGDASSTGPLLSLPCDLALLAPDPEPPLGRGERVALGGIAVVACEAVAFDVVAIVDALAGGEVRGPVDDAFEAVVLRLALAN